MRDAEVLSGRELQQREEEQQLKIRERALKVALKQLHELVREEGPDGSSSIDRSDCGAAKRRKLTAQQKRWARGDRFGDDDELYMYDSDEDDSDDGVGAAWFASVFNQVSAFARQRQHMAAAAAPAPPGCDCGQPHRRVGGIHLCRFFGYFECVCGNRWTSAYTWKGERQACRRCNTESAPKKMEKLDGRVGMGNGKPHDSSRCSMCAQLGRDCSIG